MVGAGNTRVITVALLLAAIVCYALGMFLPATALLLGGGVLELAFWVRVLRRRKPGPGRD